jgi:hypothetical protein
MMFTAYRLSCGSSKSTGAALCAALPLHSDSFHLARMKLSQTCTHLDRSCTGSQDGAGSYPGNRSHQVGGVDLLPAKLRNLASQPKDDDPIRDLKHDVVQVMRDHDHRVIFFLQFPDQPHHAAALLDTQRGGRLVEQHDGRISHDAPPDCDALPLPA